MASGLTLIDSLGNSVKFLKEFMRDPTATGAVAPSSSFLAQRVVEWIDWNQTNHLMEWGPGTGSFTQSILDQKPESCSYLAFEINPEMCDLLKKRFPGIDICQESVANVAQTCESQCIEEVDCVVSGLPWASFSDEMQTSFLDAMMCVLRPGGQFTTFAYIHGMFVPAGLRFRKKLKRYFSEVTQSKVVWMNVPPAFVYRCRR